MSDAERQEQIDSLMSYRKSLQETITSCEKESDYRATYISGGAIALIFAFMASELFLQTTLRGLLIAGVSLEILALMMNLCSFFVTKRACRKDTETIDKWIEKGEPNPVPNAYNTSLARAKKIDNYNFYNMLVLILGICLLAVFAFLNIPATRAVPTTEQHQQSADTPLKFQIKK